MVDARVSGQLTPRTAVARWLAGLAALGAPACAASPSPPTVPMSTPAARAPGSGFSSDLRIIEAKGQGLAFPLPDPAGWRLDKREKHSWVARHLQSSSKLLVRAWHFDGIARPEDCEREARLWRNELPRFTPSEVISESERMLAGAYRGRVTVGVRRGPTPTPERLFGDVLGFGSDARDCLLLAFSTSAVGPDADLVIAERLAMIAGTVFERARRLEIEGRVSVPRL
jgi:hypothetical protein